jgi:hypothetical protein
MSILLREIETIHVANLYYTMSITIRGAYAIEIAVIVLQIDKNHQITKRRTPVQSEVPQTRLPCIAVFHLSYRSHVFVFVPLPFQWNEFSFG